MNYDEQSRQDLHDRVSDYPTMMQSTIESLAVAILNDEISSEPQYNCDMEGFANVYSAAISVSHSIKKRN